ncbi:response regulator [Thalassotalea fusca]
MKVNSIATRVSVGVFAIIVILCAIVGFNISQHSLIKGYSKQSFEHDVPATQLSLNIKYQLARALDALRGWSSIGDEQFRRDFNVAWLEIQQFKNELTLLLESEAVLQNSKLRLQFRDLSNKLNELQTTQKKVLNIAQTPDNFPGIQLLNFDIEPKVKQILALVTQLIEMEAARPPEQQSFDVLKQMADFRASLATSASSFRIYLLSRNDTYRLQFQTQSQNNSISLQRLKSLELLLSDEQLQVLAELESYHAVYAPLPQKLIEMRLSEDWNVSQMMLNGIVAQQDSEVRRLIDEVYLVNYRQMMNNMTEIEHSQNSAYSISIVSLVVGIVFGLAMTYFLTRMITAPIDQVLKIANSISRGNFNVDTDIRGTHEVVQLSNALSNMLKMLRKVATHAQAVAKGKYDNTFIPSSDEDQLGKAIQRMSQNLSETTRHNELQNWSSTGVANFNTALQGLTDIDEILPVITNFVGNYFNAQVGALYLLERGKLKLTSSYAYKYRNNSDVEFSLGQGLVGQAAQERKTIVFCQPKADETPLEVSTGFATMLPHYTIVTPLINQQNTTNALVGVLAVGSVEVFNETQIETLEKITQNAAVTIDMARSRIRLQELLEESQVQAEELQAQQEELRVANEELEQQTQILKEAQEEQQRQSDKLAKSNEDLQKQSTLLEEQKRVLEIKNNEVEEAKRRIEETAQEVVQASKYKSEFLANMSHELRTPLNSLLILSETLIANDDGNLLEDQIEDLEIIHSGGNKLLTLINDILDLAKVESGKLSIIKEDFSLQEFANSISAEFEPVATKKQLVFKIAIDESIPHHAHTDVHRLEQIIRNLLSNALKFTHKGEVSFTISTSSDSKVLEKLMTLENTPFEQSLVFKVTDTGVGIEQGAQAAIFEAFQQADGSTSRKYGGTGLGLTISRELALLLGGYITLDSAPNEGSTFTLYLPYIEPKVINADDHELIVEYSNADDELDHVFIDDDRESLEDADSNIVLVIEDDPQFAKSLVKIAHQRGFKCIATDTGRSGLALVNRYPVSAIILDLGLPDFSGTKVLEGLKASPATKDIPVHIISGRDEATEETHQAIGFLTKPADISSLNKVFGLFEQEINNNFKRILLIEDDKENCYALKKLFSKKQMEVTSTSYGTEAISLLNDNHYDCVVLDLTLDDMNGIQWLEQCEKEDINLPPVVVYTGEELSEEKYKNLLNYTNSIVIKGNRSAERLFDEIILFLSSSNQEKAPISEVDTTSVKELFANKKILLVDDDIRNTYALSKVLKAKGMNIIIADNGQMAVDKVSSEQDIDLILMDIMMPVMDGYEAIKQIREQNQHPYPIIALTAKAMAEDREQCINAGANDYLTKPVETKKLLEMVKVWLNQ